MFNLEEWQYLFTYGYMDIFGYKSLRVGIDKLTGEKVISYVIK